MNVTLLIAIIYFNNNNYDKLITMITRY